MTELTYLTPVTLVGMILIFGVLIPLYQLRAYRHALGIEGGAEDVVEGGGKGSFGYLWRIPVGKTFHLADSIGVFVLLFLLLSPLLIGDVGKVAGAQDVPPDKQGKELTVAAVVANMILFVGLAAIVLARFKMSGVGLVNGLGLRWGDRRGWVLTLGLIPVCIVVVFVAGYLLGLLGWFGWVEKNFGDPTQEAVKALAGSKDIVLVVLTAISAVLIAPVAEELLFRVYVQGVLVELTRPAVGILFAGLFFGLAHGKLGVFPLLFVFGILLGMLYHFTRSVWPPVICHLLFNLINVATALTVVE